MKNLSESSCGDYLFICIKGLCNNIYHLTVVYSDLGATPCELGAAEAMVVSAVDV